ncbi:hypothetical protein [Pseudomonas citronellolis]|nr:hypothetical protein [Pseudomonas citronellolis]WRT85392.1 hypothetical protein VK748_13465 [Pseudomonas citronellolis]
MQRLLAQSQGGRQDFAQILEVPLVMALGVALIASTPQGQEAWQKVAPQLSASVREDVQKLAVYLLLLNPGSPFSTGSITTLPIADLGPLRPLGYPADNGPDKADPGSAGYGAGGKVELPVSTGGSRIDESGGWSTSTPAESMPGLGNVYNEEKPTLVTNPKHVPGGDGFRPSAGVQPSDYADAYKSAVKIGNAWWGVSTDGQSIYRYFESGDGTVHWAGSTGDSRNPLKQKDVHPQVLKVFGFKAKGSKSPW